MKQRIIEQYVDTINIKRTMRRLGLTQQKIADKVESQFYPTMNAGHINKFINNGNSTIESLIKFCTVTKIPPNEVVMGTWYDIDVESLKNQIRNSDVREKNLKKYIEELEKQIKDLNVEIKYLRLKKDESK